MLDEQNRSRIIRLHLRYQLPTTRFSLLDADTKRAVNLPYVRLQLDAREKPCEADAVLHADDSGYRLRLAVHEQRAASNHVARSHRRNACGQKGSLRCARGFHNRVDRVLHDAGANLYHGLTAPPVKNTRIWCSVTFAAGVMLNPKRAVLHDPPILCLTVPIPGFSANSVASHVKLRV